VSNPIPPEFWLRHFLQFNRRQAPRKECPSITKMRAGQMCFICTQPLPAPHTAGLQRCELCSLPPTRRILMSFSYKDDKDGWHCQFLDWDGKSTLPKRLHFRDAQKVYETARRGHGLLSESYRLALDEAIKIGRGSIALHLTNAQYQTLKRTNNETGTETKGDNNNAK